MPFVYFKHSNLWILEPFSTFKDVKALQSIKNAFKKDVGKVYMDKDSPPILREVLLFLLSPLVFFFIFLFLCCIQMILSSTRLYSYSWDHPKSLRSCMAKTNHSVNKGRCIILSINHWLSGRPLMVGDGALDGLLHPNIFGTLFFFSFFHM